MSFTDKVLRGLKLVIVWGFMFALLFYGDKFLGFGISKLSMGVFALGIFTLPLALLITLPKLRSNFMNYFLLSDKKHLIIGLPILLAIGMRVVFNFVDYILVWMGGDMIESGSGQFVPPSETLSAMGAVILVCVIGPFLEEVLFRYIPYTTVLWGANRAKEHSIILNKLYFNLFIEKNTKYVWGWILFTSFLFAMVHGPNILNFWVYFIPGVVLAWLFLRYGFFSALLAHSIFNFYSDIGFEMLKYVL
ncbi:CPBP family intramembrane metalloprotease [Bacillus cereus]|nr:CPBP family intramembrane metalloprotease [Bacillus cereus]